MVAPIGRTNSTTLNPTTGTNAATSATGGATTATVNTATDAAAVGTTGWVPGAPTSGGAANVAGAAPTSVLSSLSNESAKNFELVPGRYPDAVSFPTVLKQVGSTPEGRAGLNKVMDGISAQTGVPISPALRAAVMADPTMLTKALEMTPAQLSEGIASTNESYRQGKIKQPAPAVQILPAKFDLSKWSEIDAPRPTAELKELAPGLLQGDLPSDLPDEQVKKNRVLAEVLGRLTANASAAPEARFGVSYKGQEYNELDGFLKALTNDGYQVDVRFDSRVANFSNLKTPVPGSNPVKYLDVPAPLMIKTGVKDGLGVEAEVPAAHSEMVISIKPGANTTGPKLAADAKFYQGLSATGFFPVGVWADPTWAGKVTHASITGDAALKAVTIAGAFTDLINTVAKKADLYASGYGVTGVCNDSVAVIEQAVTGEARQYPLLMQDAVLTGALRDHLSQPGSDVASYRAIKTAIDKLPSDVLTNPTIKRRAGASMPWASGREPFHSSIQARRILIVR